MCFSQLQHNFIYNTLEISVEKVYFMKQKIVFFYFPRMLLLLLTSDSVKPHCDIFPAIEPMKSIIPQEFHQDQPMNCLLAFFLHGQFSYHLLSSWCSPSIISEERNQICNFLGSEEGISLFQISLLHICELCQVPPKQGFKDLF